MIPYQPEFRLALPTVYGPKDYRDFRAILEQIDRFLVNTGIEERFVSRHLAKLRDASELSKKRKESYSQRVRRALRYGIVRALTGESIRDVAIRTADSNLLQWFTLSSPADRSRPLSKSTIERMEKMFNDGEIAALVHEGNRAASDEQTARELLLRETGLRMDRVFADTTCVKADIHFPVDWVLLRDAARTLIKAVVLIRRHGLRHRIGSPEEFLRDMNRLCIEMTHTRKKADATKHRKQILRRMKKLVAVIERHGWNYCNLLESEWDQTDWSEAEATVVLKRMKNVLGQLPAAVKQVHERMIGERRVPNKEKILSLYESNAHVLVRGKAGAEVEFGNALYLAEQKDGLIIDWEFLREQPPADSRLMEVSLARITSEYGKPLSYAADRGFDSAANREAFEKLEVFNAVCPRSPASLSERLLDTDFRELQKRRGGTEARIGIFKNAYLGRPLKSKGFKNRRIRIEWCVLTHNLWKLAVMAVQAREEAEEEVRHRKKAS